MQTEILYKPSYAILKVQLNSGDSILAESGSMVSMSSNMNVETSLNISKSSGKNFFGNILSFLGAIFKALIRKLLGGESFFINTFSTSSAPGEVLLAPTVTGDIVHKSLKGESIIIQGGAFLACSKGIELKIKFTGLRGLFSGEGLFLLEVSGTGDLWINSYGGIEEIKIDGNFTVDTGHMVAFDSNITYKIKAVGGLKSTLFSGEGLVMEFSGKGNILIQSRNLGSFTGWINPLLPH